MTKLERFIKALEDNGDFFFDTGSKRQDLQYVQDTISRQGYWSGIRLHFYFDDNLNLLRTEERRFGRDETLPDR